MLSVEGSRYEYETNVLMYSAKTGISIREVWISTVYLNENASSHFRPVRDTFRIYKDILKLSISSFVSFLIDYVLFCLLSREKTGKSAVKYFLHAGMTLLCNTLILKGFVFIGLNAYLAKILTEILLFVYN